jgi:hypothetical protein
LVGTGVVVERGTGVSEGAAVAVVFDCDKGNLQAAITIERIKKKVNKMIGLLDRFIGASFFEAGIGIIIQASCCYERLVCIKLIFF